MKKRMILFVVGLLVSIGLSTAQVTNVSGVVVSVEDGEPVIGASVLVNGTEARAITDLDGKFCIPDVPPSAETLVVSYIGMRTMEVRIKPEPMRIELESDSELLDEVVVTAQGLRRQKRSLGYATQEIKSADLTSVAQQGLNNAIAGKVAGVRFVGGSGAKFDEGTIVIRGATTLTNGAGTKPLYVVDGVIAEAAAVNMNDVESINVLKGPAATALYGVLGGNGAVVITTRSGHEGEPSQRIDISNTLSWTTAYSHARLQKEYGGGTLGADGQLPTYHWREGDPEYYRQFEGRRYYDYASDGSWGPRLDPTVEYMPAIAWDVTSPYFGVQDTWTDHLNLDDLFRTGLSDNTNVAFERSGKDHTSRVSFSNTTIRGVTPNSDAQRRYAGVKTAFTAMKNLRVSLDYKYTYKKNHNAAYEEYGGGQNPYSMMLQWGHTNVNLKQYRDYVRPDGTLRSWSIFSPTNLAAASQDCPAAIYNEINATNIRQFHILSGDLEYALPLGIKIGYRLTANLYNFRQVYNRSELVGLTAMHQQWQQQSADVYNQGRVTWSGNFLDGRLELSAAAFIESRDYHFEGMDVFTRDGLLIPGFYNTGNSGGVAGGSDASPDQIANVLNEYDHSNTRRQRTQSVFGTFTAGWNDTYFVDVSMRNDWNSTLPAYNNSYLYGGLSASVVASNWIKKAPWLNYWKLRGSLAQVGSSLDPYQLSDVYYFGYRYNGTASMYGNPTLIDRNIKPAITTSYEVGTEFSLFNDRVFGDINFYSRDTKNQIIRTTVGAASGYSARLTNAGLIRNRGYEVSLGVRPVKRADVEWTVEANIAHNENTLVELTPGMTRYRLDGMGFFSFLYSYAEVGKPMGALYVTRSWLTNDAGQMVLAPNANGDLMPQLDQSTEKYMGNVQPKLTGGLSTMLRVKDFTLRASMDYRVGGKLASITNMFMEGSGVSATTAGRNDRGGELRGAVAAGGGVRVDGVVANADGTYSPATAYVEASTYFQKLKQTLWGPYIYDASYVKMRELSLAYNVPKGVLKRLHLGLTAASLSFVATDPFLIYSKVPNIDPSEANGTMLESGQAVSTRSWGFTVSLTL